MAQLVVQIDGQPPVVHELTDAVITIGRETDNVVVIADASVSRHHAEILASDGPRTLRDLNSANGTTVNGSPITERMLKPGDVIHFGHAKVNFVTKASVAAKAPPVKPAGSPPPTVQDRPQEPPPLIASAKPSVLEPVVPEILLVPVENPLPKGDVPQDKGIAPQEKSPPLPAVRTQPPTRVPKGKARTGTPKAPSSPMPSSPVETVLPPTKAAAATVGGSPPPPAVPAVQPPAAKAPLQAPAPLPLPPTISPPKPVAKPPLPASVVGKAPTPQVVPPAGTTKAPPSIDSKASSRVAPILPAPAPAKAPLPAVEKPLTPAPAEKNRRPDIPVVKKQISAHDTAKRSLPALVAASELPPVPDDVGRGPSALAPVKGVFPAPLGFPEDTTESDDAPSFLTRRSLVVSGVAALLLAALAIGAHFLRRPPSHPANTITPPRVMATAESKAEVTKKCWDRLQEIARVGLQQAQDVPFQYYPLMPNGVYDFQAIDDKALDTLMTSLTTRANGLLRVSQELAALGKTNVDTDLAAYINEVGSHWERAASLDSDAVNLAWAVHERRARPADANSPTLESADTVLGGNLPPEATVETMDHVTKLANAWLSERGKFAEAGGRIDLKEKEIYRQMSARYRDQFK